MVNMHIDTIEKGTLEGTHRWIPIVRDMSIWAPGCTKSTSQCLAYDYFFNGLFKVGLYMWRNLIFIDGEQ